MFLKIDGMKDLSLKINGFGRTHRTHTDGAPAPSCLSKLY